jgi:hypothetical protein
MKTLTPQQIIDLNPCRGYDLEQLEKLFGNKESVTYLEILNTDKIPLEDIIWVFCRPTVLDDDISNQWLEVIITRAVTNYALHCGIDDVEKWATNWLSGVDRTIKAAVSARNAATNAATNATRAATTVYATNYALDAAAYATYAAHTAGYSAVYAAHAANDADYATLEIEHKQQIQDLKDILQGKKQ